MLMQKILPNNRLTAFGLDVVAIFIGISASLLVDEWRDEIKLDDKRRAILFSIRLDLKEDAEWVEGTLGWNTTRVQAVTELLDPEMVETCETDSLIQLVRNTFPYHGFFNQGFTFESLNMELTTLVTNPELRRALNGYYHKTYEFIRSNERISYDFAMDRYAYLRSAPFIFHLFASTRMRPELELKILIYISLREKNC